MSTHSEPDSALGTLGAEVNKAEMIDQRAEARTVNSRWGLFLGTFSGKVSIVLGLER